VFLIDGWSIDGSIESSWGRSPASPAAFVHPVSAAGKGQDEQLNKEIEAQTMDYLEKQLMSVLKKVRLMFGGGHGWIESIARLDSG